MIKHLVLALAAAATLSACSLTDSFYGPADTDATTAYRFEGRYIYLATAVDAYVSSPSADASVTDKLCRVDAAAFEAVVAGTDAMLSSGDKATTGLVLAGVALRNLALTVLDDWSLSGTVESVGKRTVVLGALAAESLVRMRVFRTTFLEPQLDAYAEAGVDPVAEDFAVLRSRATRLHQSIQSACAG